MDRAEGASSSAQWSPHDFPSTAHQQNATTDDTDFSTLLDLDVGDIDLGEFSVDDSHSNAINLGGSGHVTPNAQHGAGSIQPLESLNESDFLGFAPSDGQHPNQQFPHDIYGPSQQQMNFQQHSSVPPTPSSFEMQGGVGPMVHGPSNHHAAYKQHFNQSQQNMFTPATTPAENAFQLPQSGYTVPGAYFSPLTSPSIEPRNYSNHMAYQSYVTSATSSTATSPIDFPVNHQEELPTPVVKQKRKTRASQRATPRSTGPTPTIQPSPPVTGRRKRGSASTSDLPAQAVMQQTQTGASHPGNLLHPSTASNDGQISSADSVSSPEPLSESLMGPPPRPKSSSHSPHIVANQQDPKRQPATPASLMRLAAQRSGSNSAENTPRVHPNGGSVGTSAQSSPAPVLEDFALPEAASGGGHSKRSSIVSVEDIAQDAEVSAQSGSRKTPKLNPLSTPNASIKASPSASALTSPVSTVSTLPQGRSGRGGAGKRGRKVVSPSLRPKISPQIKPLLPGGGNGDESHAILLASRSNYQNIIEGTNVPGLTYHKDLSTTLTSKRTSHKIAEQGRRNRINTALLEMQALLPPSSPGTAPSGTPATPTGAVTTSKSGSNETERPSTSGSASANAKAVKSPDLTPQQQNSKASTVESAIEYIKALKQEVGEKDAALAVKDAELARLREQLKGIDVGDTDESG